VTPNQCRRHHSPKGNRSCVDAELLALVLKMIVSPTLNSLSQIWRGGRRRIVVESYLRGLEIKYQWLEWNPLDFNTSVGGSLSENVSRKCRHVLMALSTNEERVEGYI